MISTLLFTLTLSTKYPKKLSQRINKTINDSYVDDINSGISALDIEHELTNPTFKHPPNFKDMEIQKQVDLTAISDGITLIKS